MDPAVVAEMIGDANQNLYEHLFPTTTTTTTTTTITTTITTTSTTTSTTIVSTTTTTGDGPHEIFTELGRIQRSDH